MSVRQANLIAASITVLIGILFILFSIPIYSNKIGGGPGAGVFPLWVGLVMGICGVFYFWNSLAMKAPEQWMIVTSEQRIFLWASALSMVAYVAFMPLLGFALASFLLLCLHLRWIGHGRWFPSILIAAVVSASTAFCFRILLYIPLPRGFVGW